MAYARMESFDTHRISTNLASDTWDGIQKIANYGNSGNPKDKWIKAATNGFTTASGYPYRGIDELIDEVTWHKENKVFNVSRRIYEQDEVYLEDNFVVLNE